MNAISELKRMPSTKGEIASFVESAKNEILSGAQNPLTLEIQLKAMEEVIKSIRKDPDVKRYIISEIDTFPGKTFEFMGVSITKKSMRSYDFSTDSQWRAMSSKIDLLKEEIKQHEEMLKTLKGNVYSEETGEMITPPVVEFKETYAITFK